MSTTPDPGKAPPPTWPTGAKPSLLSGSGPADDDGPVSILSAMDDTPPPSRPKLSQRQLWPWLGGGLVAAAGLIWLANAQKAEAERPVQLTSQGAASAASAAHAASSVHTAAVASAGDVTASAASAASAPAVIELTIAATSTPALAAASAPQSAASAPNTSGDTLLMAAGTGAAATALVAAAAPQAAASSPKKLSKRAKARAEREAAAAEKSAQSAPRKTSTGASLNNASPANSADPDVDLIAAVMRHGDVPPTGRSTEADASQTSIAGMVSRCKSLGGDEAKACRQRLCEGYWGKAEACPKRLAPKSSSKASTEAKPTKRKKKKPRTASKTSNA